MSLFGKRFRDLVPEFLAYHAVDNDDQESPRCNMEVLKRHFGDMRLSKIGAAEIRAMIAARRKEGRAKGTINRQRAALSGFFTWAISEGYHPGPNPVRQVRAYRESPGRDRFLSEMEARRLEKNADPHLRPLIVAALETGGRRGELLKLRWGDVNFDRRTVHFREQTTKSGRPRTIPMTPRLADLFRGMPPGDKNDLIFRFPGEPLSRIHRAFLRARKEANLGSDVLFHTLRHTFASWFMMNGGDIYRLQKYMGHHNIAVTQRYSHLSPEYVQEGVQFIGPPGTRRDAQKHMQ